MYQKDYENIEVLVKFTRNKIRPYLFKWNGRNYKIEDINLIQATKKGESRLYYFAASNKADNFTLCFDSTNLEWALENQKTPR